MPLRLLRWTSGREAKPFTLIFAASSPGSSDGSVMAARMGPSAAGISTSSSRRAAAEDLIDAVGLSFYWSGVEDFLRWSFQDEMGFGMG